MEGQNQQQIQQAQDAVNQRVRTASPNRAQNQVNNVASTPEPTDPSQVTAYLNNIQNQIYRTEQAKEVADLDLLNATDAEIQASIDNALDVGMEIPEAPSLEEFYNNQRKIRGLDQMEANLNKLVAQQRDLTAETRQRINNERGERVGMGVIAGRVGEIERQGNERLDAVNREIAYQQSMIESSYNVIQTLSNLKSQDWQMSTQEYQMRYETNLNRYQMFREVKGEQFERQMIQREQAMANLEVYMDLIREGSLDVASLDGQTRKEIRKMEAMSGMPKGFIDRIQMAPDARTQVLGQRVAPDGSTYVDIRTVNPDGSVEYSSQFLGKSYVGGLHSRSGSSGGSEKSLSNEEGTFVQLRQDAQQARTALAQGADWSMVWESIKEKYPKMDDEDIDELLGVPEEHLVTGDPGYDYWYDYIRPGGKYTKETKEKNQAEVSSRGNNFVNFS